MPLLLCLAIKIVMVLENLVKLALERLNQFACFRVVLERLLSVAKKRLGLTYHLCMCIVLD